MKYIAILLSIATCAFAEFNVKSFAIQKCYQLSKDNELSESSLAFLYAPDTSAKEGHGYYVIMLPDQRTAIMNTEKWNEFYNIITAYYSLKNKYISSDIEKGEFRKVAGNIQVEIDGEWKNLEVSFTKRIKGVNARALEISIESAGKFYLTNINDDAILNIFRQDEIGQLDFELRN